MKKETKKLIEHFNNQKLNLKLNTLSSSLGGGTVNFAGYFMSSGRDTSFHAEIQGVMIDQFWDGEDTKDGKAPMI